MAIAQGSKILASDVTSDNTASTIVMRDANKGFKAGEIDLDKAVFGTASYGIAFPESPKTGQAFFQLTDPWYELPAGGTTGQVLTKASDDNYDVEWGDGGSGDEGESIDFDQIYPIGSIYITTSTADPATLFGGTWVQLKDSFLLAVGDVYKPVKSTGGQVKITTDNLPNHTHTMQGAGGHNHYVPASNSAYGGGYVTFAFSTERGSGDYGNIHWTNSVGNHSHTVDSSGGKADPDPFLPPYIVVYMWERTA